jgi:ribosomal protein S18 acetylase RimI-like enzyme
MSEMVIKNYHDDTWSQLVGLLKDYPHKPYRGYGLWSPERLSAHFQHHVHQAVSNQCNQSWIAVQGDQLVGLACLGPLDWDSQQLDLKTARLECLISREEEASDSILQELVLDKVSMVCQETGIRYLLVRQDAGDINNLQALENAGFVILDGLLTYMKHLTQDDVYPYHNVGFRIRAAGVGDLEALSSIARRAFIFDRYHADPIIPDCVADDLHEAWLHNSVLEKAADIVLLAEDQEGILGFVTGKLNPDTVPTLGSLVGSIILVATADHARGRGIARALTFSALSWFGDQGAVVVSVGTQMQNLPAARLYQSCGFSLAGSSLTLRKLVEGYD